MAELGFDSLPSALPTYALWHGPASLLHAVIPPEGRAEAGGSEASRTLLKAGVSSPEIPTQPRGQHDLPHKAAEA